MLALSTAFKELLWWKRFFDSIEFKLEHSTQIQCDNMQTIRAFTSDSSQFTTKLRHVNIHKHWLRQEVQNHSIYITWTSSSTIISDGLTKALSSQRHKDFIKHLGLERDSHSHEDGDASFEEE